VSIKIRGFILFFHFIRKRRVNMPKHNLLLSEFMVERSSLCWFSSFRRIPCQKRILKIYVPFWMKRLKKREQKSKVSRGMIVLLGGKGAGTLSLCGTHLTGTVFYLPFLFLFLL